MPAIPSHDTGTVETPWDMGANVGRCPAAARPLRAMHAWVDPDGDPDTKAAYKFPHHMYDDGVGPANLPACRNGLARLSSADIPSSDDAGVRAHLDHHLEAARAMTHPRDDLVRAVFPGVELRDADPSTDDPGLGTLTGHFSIFDTWYEVDSLFEGRFMERIAPGAFAATIARDRDAMRVTLNHGHDPQAGDKPLGPIAVLEEDRIGPRYEVPLIDTSYNRDIAPGLRAGLYGSSFRFSVTDEVWDDEPAKSRHNPDRLPERTVTGTRVYEFGPVTFPANPKATAGMRSLTDEWRSRASPERPAASIPPAQPPKEIRTVELAEPVQTSDPVSRAAAVSRTDRPARIAELAQASDAFAREHTGNLSAELQAEWDGMIAELRALNEAKRADDERLAVVADQLARAQSLAPQAPFSGVIDTQGPRPMPNVRRQRVQDIFNRGEIRAASNGKHDERQLVRDCALRYAETMVVPSERYDQDKSREHLQSLIEHHDDEEGEIAERVLATSSPQYRDAFFRWVRTLGQERGTALAVGVDGTGGYAVPVAFDPTIVAIGAWTAINPYRASCRVETIAGTDTWQALTATAITAAYAAEAAAATEQGPTFTRPEYVVKRAHAFVTASYEMLQDRPGLPAELGRLFGEAKDNLEENQFTVGVGSTVYPQGIGLKDAFTRVDSVTNDTVAVADIRAVVAALPIRHRFMAAWYLSRAAITAIQAFETTGGQLFSGVGYPATPPPAVNRTGNTGLTLLGFPIWETPSMPWTPTTDDTTWGVLMDPANYVIVDRVGMSIRIIADMLDGATPSMPTGESGIYAFWRNTARVLNVDGGRQGAVQ